MGSVGVELRSVVPAMGLVRLSEGQRLRGVVGDPSVGLLQHWASGRSQLCLDPVFAGECPWCTRGDVPQWYAYVPIRHVLRSDGEEKTVDSLVQMGARSLASSGCDSLRYLVGREVELRRPKKRRFVEFQVMLEATPWSAGTCGALATLFGAGRFFDVRDRDPFRELHRAVKRLRGVASGGDTGE